MTPDEAGLSPEDLYRLLAENATDIVYQTDGLDIMWISPSVTALLGWKPDELVGRPAGTIVSPHQDLSFVESNRARLAAGETVDQEMLLIGADGSERWFLGRARPVVSRGVAVGGFMVGLHDIHEARTARQALERSERQYRSAIRHAGVGIMLLAPDQSTIEVNRALCAFLGRPASELLACSWRDITHPDDLAAEEEQLLAAYRGEQDTFRLTKRYLHSDGSVRHGDLTVAVAREDDGSVSLVTKQVIDITEQVTSREQLTVMATTDALTGLPNRSSIVSELARRLSARRRDPDRSGEKEHVGVLFVDLDNFKLVNDSLGHAAGDALLTLVSERLRERLDPAVPVGRFGGDEFLVIAPAPADEQVLAEHGRRISEALAEGFTVHGRRMVMTASTGAALSQPDSSAAALLQDADVALSEAKGAGKSQWRVFNLGMASAAIRRLVLESELRDAIERDEFVTHYQPVVRLADGQVVGYEALLRWEHPTEGLLYPGAFLGVAEDTGLIIPIGELSLRSVCRDLAAHPEVSATVAVNVSAVQLADVTWADRFLAVLEDGGIPPRRIILELTETAVMSTRRDLGDDLRRLRALGVEVHVDDFGTGYSSVSLLRDLPVSGLKLDRSFVSRLDEDDDHSGYALAEGLAGLARAIGLQGVAEGVETPVQAAYLRAMGWGHAQGWHFGRAEPLEHWLGATGRSADPG